MCHSLFSFFFSFSFSLIEEGPEAMFSLNLYGFFKIGSYCPIYLLNYAPIKKSKGTALPGKTGRQLKGKRRMEREEFQLINYHLSFFPVTQEHKRKDGLAQGGTRGS